MKAKIRLNLLWQITSLLALLGIDSRLVHLHAADTYWTNTVGGNWSTASNWSPNQVPGSGDNAVITNNGTYTIALNVNATVASLAIGAQSGTQTLSVASTLTLSSTSIFEGNAVLALTDGTLTGSGDVTIMGSLNWMGGAMLGSGRSILMTNASANFTSGMLGRQFDNYGTVNLIDNGSLNGWVNGAAYHSGTGYTFNNYGMFNVLGRASLGTYVDFRIVSTFNNYGTLRKTGSGTATFQGDDAGYPYYNGVSFVNAGTLDLSGGTMQFYSYGHSTSTPIEVKNGATFKVASGQFNFPIGGGLTGAGAIELDAGTYNFFADAFTPTGTVNFYGATVTINNSIAPANLGELRGTVAFNAPQTFPLLSLNGTLTGSAEVTITSMLDWIGGQMLGTGKTVLASNAMASCNTITMGRQFDNYGTVNIADNGGMYGWYDGSVIGGAPAAFAFNNYGTLNLLGRATFGRYQGVRIVSTFNNYGTLRKTGSGTATFQGDDAGYPYYNGVNLVNSGTARIEQGLVRISGNLSPSPTSALEVLIAGRAPGSGNGQLVVDGAIHIKGTLNVGLRNGFVPSVGDTFRVITWTSQSGGFAEQNGLDLGNGLFFQSICDGAGLSLVTRTSNPATPPSPTNLVDQVVAVGQNVTFSISLGDDPFTYQWQFNGTNIIGATNASLTIFNAQPADAGAYCVKVIDALNVTNTYCATLAVQMPPSITTQPVGQVVLSNANVTFNINATGSAPLQYQWRLNGANIPGATNATYAITNAQPKDGGNYDVVVVNAVGAVSSAIANLLVPSAALPFADNFAARGTISGRTGLGSGTNLLATHEAGEPSHAGKVGSNSVWLQWTAPTNGVALFNSRGSSFDTLLAIYSGTNLSNLSEVASDDDRGGFFTSEAVFNARAGSNYVIALDGFAGARGNIVLTWNLDTNITETPKIIQQPVSVTASPGGNATFDVFAASSTNLTYQWFFNDCLAIPGATNATLAVTNIGSLQVGFYTVEITSAAGPVAKSAAAFLEIGPVPQALTHDKFEDLLNSGGGGAGLIASRKGAPALIASAGSGFVSVSMGAVGSQILNNTGASTQEGEPIPCGVLGGASRWFGLLPASNGVMLVDTIGSGIDTVLVVYTGPSLTNLTYVACDNNGAPDGIRSLLRFNTTAGTKYYLAVDGVNGAQGVINLNWGLGTVPVVTSPQTNSTFRQGGDLTLTVATTNTVPPPAYQWRLEGRTILGATNATLTVSNIQSTQAGLYSVVVSNFAGLVINPIAQITVALPIELSYELTTHDGATQFRLKGPSSQGFAIEASANLNTWTRIYTNASSSAPIDFLDTQASNYPTRFYRVVPWP